MSRFEGDVLHPRTASVPGLLTHPGPGFFFRAVAFARSGFSCGGRVRLSRRSLSAAVASWLVF